MRSYAKDQTLQSRIERAGVSITTTQARILRRAELTLQRWAEGECGDGNDYVSWSIERDEKTGKPYRCVYPHKGQARRYPIADLEAGALRRVAKVCAETGLHYYHQTDPRGCALYVSPTPIDAMSYTRGTGCAV